MHIKQHFSLHISVNVPGLANELIFIRSPWAGYNIRIRSLSWEWTVF